MAPAALPALAEILALELRLQDPAVRADAAAVGALLMPDFFEIGSSGTLEDRAAIVGRLQDEARAGGFVPPTVTDATLRPLPGGLVALTYTTSRPTPDGPPRRVLRTSVWANDGGKWRMAFHQGTVAATG
ncbi:nuclear transport factor 2 family protein [uncultured Alsobacter sp.]|uniref:nuclear transport factor 2 family protein n=1 Tax=uncultured Alsobacter sp. TaxID=1748258 RepID=UPI0025DF4B73|nr:nuclear transport factor 2 family protein [uncultured Alsobacter sp.]